MDFATARRVLSLGGNPLEDWGLTSAQCARYAASLADGRDRAMGKARPQDARIVMPGKR